MLLTVRPIESVLPAIREVTKTEIASIVQLQISKGLETSLAEVSNFLSRLLTSAVL